MKIRIKKRKITDLKGLGKDLNHPCILGIDPSLTHTGIIVLSMYGVVKHNITFIPKTKGAERLVDLGSRLQQILWEYHPVLAVMEGYGYNPRQGNLMGLGELGGIYKTTLYQNHVPLHIVAPMSLKKFATGSGKGDKNLIMLKAYKKYGVEFKDDNQLDAYVLAQIGLRIKEHKEKRMPLNVPKYELEVLATILKHETT